MSHHPLRSTLAPLVIGLGALGSAHGADPDGPETRFVPPADHHVHVWSADAVAAKARIEAEVLGRDGGGGVVVGAGAVVASLDSANVPRAVLLSTAYFFGIPDLAIDSAAARTRAENAWVAAQARRFPDRLVAFFSANPLAPYAVPELDHCGAVAECRGFKLQLANSDIDFRDTADVRGLRRFFAAANERGLPLVVHLQTRRPDFGAREVDTFIDRVLPAAPDIPIQIAHLGGNSQYDAATRRAAGAFLSALQDHPGRTAHLFFDLAVVPLPESLARGDSALLARVREQNRQFAEMARQLGPDRVVFGSDYPESGIGDYLRGIEAALPMEPAEIKELLDDPAPSLEPVFAAGS